MVQKSYGYTIKSLSLCSTSVKGGGQRGKEKRSLFSTLFEKTQFLRGVYCAHQLKQCLCSGNKGGIWNEKDMAASCGFCADERSAAFRDAGDPGGGSAEAGRRLCRDFTRVEGGTYFSERTGESTYRERIHTYICPENNGGKHILEYHKEAPTCTEGDYNAYYCVLCGERELNVEFPALGHAYTDTVTTPATKEAPGVRTYTCSRCGDSYTEEIPPLESGAEEGTGSAESQEPGGEEADSCPHNT